MKPIIAFISILLMFSQVKQYNYSTTSVDIYLAEHEGGEWTYNNTIEQNDFFVFNTDFSKVDWKNPAGTLTFLLNQVKKDGNSTIWKAVDTTGKEHYIVLKESKNEIRIISDAPTGGKISMVFKIKKSWVSNW